MSTLTELADFLDGLGIAANGVDLFVGSRPEFPNTCLTLYEYPGGPPEYVQNSFAPIAEIAHVQVVARAVAYEDAERLAKQAWSAFAPLTNAILGGTRYRSVRPQSSPGLMGRDANDRLLVVFNMVVNKEVQLDSVS